MAKAQGWEYRRHGQFHHVMTEAKRLIGSDRLRFLHGRADILHVNFYELKGNLDAEEIRLDLESIEDLLAILAPLTARG